jgi:hypothetical protein
VVKVKKGKGFPVDAMKLYKCSRGVVIIILTLGTT